MCGGRGGRKGERGERVGEREENNRVGEGDRGLQKVGREESIPMAS